MGTLEVSATTHIDRPVDIVRRQFADVEHHADTGVHQGVVFEVTERNAERCLYRQTSRVGPVKIRQELELLTSVDGPLVNTITKGQFNGGSITFNVTPDGSGGADVHAQLSTPTNFVLAVLAPILKANVRRALSAALAEDKADLESGSYPPPTEPRPGSSYITT